MAGPSGITPKLDLPYPVPDDTVDVPRDIKALALAMDVFNSVPAGAGMLWFSNVPPPGWLILQGQTNIPADSNPGLVAIFGQTGGFVNIPNVAQKFPIAAGGSYSVGSQGGEPTVTLSPAQMPVHRHQMRHSAATNGIGYFNSGLERAVRAGGQSVSDSDMEEAGGTQPHNNIPPYFTVHFIVKLG